jgi:hypothetical protein
LQKLGEMLQSWQQLRYLSIAYCTIEPSVMGVIGQGLCTLPHLVCLDASALQQECAAEFDAGALGELVDGIAGCTRLQVLFAS